MLYVVAFVVSAGLGFAGSRLLRRPDHAAQAASVARNLGGTLGTRRGLDAPELQRACFSEMVRHVRVNRQGRTAAPGSYVLRLNPGDMSVVDEARRWFTEGLEQALRDAASQNGWRIEGPVSIRFEADPSRPPGAPSAIAATAAAAPPAVPAPPPAGTAAAVAGPPAGGGSTVRHGDPGGSATTSLALVRSDTGERVPLVGTSVTVGRSPENTVTLADDRVSRSHARFEKIGASWVVLDLESANGTRVGGSRIRPGSPIPVAPGTVVGVGPLDLRVVAVDADAPDPGTRALGEADRTRISQEVLGLPGDLPRR